MMTTTRLGPATACAAMAAVLLAGPVRAGAAHEPPGAAQPGQVPFANGSTVAKPTEDPGATADRLLSTAATPVEAALAWLAERNDHATGEPPEARLAKAVEQATGVGGAPGRVLVFDGVGGTWGALPADGATKLPERVVLCVGGLDDPRSIFDTAAAALGASATTTGTKLTILRMDPPTDQPLRASGTAVLGVLGDLGARGVTRVDLVGHSSGGLVVRDVVSRRANGAAEPSVGRVVLIATPNRGTWLAPLRAARGARVSLATWIESGGQDAVAFRMFLEAGATEAVADAVPGSGYLTELNGRPTPAWVSGKAAGAGGQIPLTVVVGTLAGGSALEGVDVKPMLAWPMVRQVIKAVDAERAVEAVEDLAKVVSDGLVPVSSAELEGAEDTVYAEANHRSLLRPWVQGEAEHPAAVKVLVERLAK